jgi:hypothetical protein
MQRAVGWAPAARAGEVTGERSGPATVQGGDKLSSGPMLLGAGGCHRP